MEKPKHVNLAALADRTVSDRAKDAAQNAFNAGLSPRAQLDAARAVMTGPGTYLPHQGSAERERRRRRQMERKAAKK